MRCNQSPPDSTSQSQWLVRYSAPIRRLHAPGGTCRPRPHTHRGKRSQRPHLVRRPNSRNVESKLEKLHGDERGKSKVFGRRGQRVTFTSTCQRNQLTHSTSPTPLTSMTTTRLVKNPFLGNRRGTWGSLLSCAQEDLPSFAGAFNQDANGAKLVAGNDVASAPFGDPSEGQVGLLLREESTP